MAYIINIQTFKDSRGILTVLDQVIPFEIKRLFYIYSVDNTDLSLPCSFAHTEENILEVTRIMNQFSG